MTSYPDFDTLALATKLKVLFLRRKMNKKTQLAKDAQVSLSSLSRIVWKAMNASRRMRHATSRLKVK